MASRFGSELPAARVRDAEVHYDARVELPGRESSPCAEGFVLVGGRSSRFGSDKALHEVDGRPMALHVADALRAHVSAVTLVGEPRSYRGLGLPVIPDAFPGTGPLGGIVSALQHAASPLCLIAACDMPLIAAAPLAPLLAEAARTGAGAVLPMTPEGRLQPLCAVYATRTRGSLADSLLRGERKILAALANIRWRPLPVDDAIPFSNMNRVSDLDPR